MGGVGARALGSIVVDGFTGNGASGQNVSGADFSVGAGAVVSIPFEPGFEIHAGITNTVIVGPVLVLPTAITTFLFGN